MSSPAPSRGWPERFLVAFSLAGENRDVVRPVAEAVESVLGVGTVFYDEWYEHRIAGGDADVRLQELYSERCVLVVACVSGRYGDKPWPRAEHAAIRSRYMKAQGEPHELAVLPIRVGDGDLEGILFNTIAPDIRGRSPEDAAKLIVDRLRSIVPEDGAAAVAVPEWLADPPALSWPMADHGEVRDKFGQLFCRAAPRRFLPVEGLSETGKTCITRQMMRNALQKPDVACGRFDFKGTTKLDNEVSAFVQHLDVEEPPANLPVSSRLGQVLNALKQRRRPTLLVFDTYEMAGDAEDWVENQLLPSLIREEWLRVVIVGQRVPKRAGSSWEDVSFPVVPAEPPPPEDWFEYGKDHKPNITLEFVRQAHKLCRGKPSVMVELFGPAR